MPVGGGTALVYQAASILVAHAIPSLVDVTTRGAVLLDHQNVLDRRRLAALSPKLPRNRLPWPADSRARSDTAVKMLFG